MSKESKTLRQCPLRFGIRRDDYLCIKEYCMWWGGGNVPVCALPLLAATLFAKVVGTREIKYKIDWSDAEDSSQEGEQKGE